MHSALLPSPAEQLLLGSVQSTGTGDALLCQLPRDAVAVSNTAILSKWRAWLNQKIASDLERQVI